MSFDQLQGIFLTYGIYSILVVCGLFFLVIWLFGFLMLVIAVRLSGRNFRAKGFLRKPSGSDWIPFLLKRHYEGFEGNGPHYFNICRFCLLAGLIVLAAAAALVGSELVFGHT
jgi:hypothetical protein